MCVLVAFSIVCVLPLCGCSSVHLLVPMPRTAVIDFVVTYVLAVQVSVCVRGGEEGGKRGLNRLCTVCLYMSFQVLLLCHRYVGWAARSQHHEKVFKL